MMFNCDQCGACCCSLTQNELYASLDRGDGVCKQFDEHTKKCKIYEQRPLICRVDDAYEHWFYNQMSKSEYYQRNYEICRKLKENILNSNKKSV